MTLHLLMNQIPITNKKPEFQLFNCQIVRPKLYRLDKQYSPISATPHLTICLIPSAFTTVRFLKYWHILKITLVLQEQKESLTLLFMNL